MHKECESTTPDNWLMSMCGRGHAGTGGASVEGEAADIHDSLSLLVISFGIHSASFLLFSDTAPELFSCAHFYFIGLIISWFFFTVFLSSD